jgi:hypothetical protein
MDATQRARWRLGSIAAVVGLLVALALVGSRLAAARPGADEAGDADQRRTSTAPPPTVHTVPLEGTDIWARPTTRDSASFAKAFAVAVWTYDTDQPYELWQQAIRDWADPLGNPASAAVGQSMLPSAAAYGLLRAQRGHATATVNSVSVPDVAADLAARAPNGWHAFTVRGTQRLTADGHTIETARQLTVAVVCVPTCWLWSVTPEVEP